MFFFDIAENVMTKVIVTQRGGQPGCWYINEISGIGVSAGKICYKSRGTAAAIARRQHPYANISIEK
jgi:hypothetical protein